MLWALSAWSWVARGKKWMFLWKYVPTLVTVADTSTVTVAVIQRFGWSALAMLPKQFLFLIGNTMCFPLVFLLQPFTVFTVNTCCKHTAVPGWTGCSHIYLFIHSEPVTYLVYYGSLLLQVLLWTAVGCGCKRTYTDPHIVGFTPSIIL